MMQMRSHEILATILNELPESWDLQTVLNVLEDGEALAILGFTDEDQEYIEEVHDSITEFLKRNTK